MRHASLLNRAISAAALALVAWGCSSQNDKAPSFNESGKHPPLAVWYQDHRNAFSVNPLQCTQCHGSDLKGGISGVNCFTGLQIPGFACHANGHPPTAIPHPIPFKAAALHGPMAKSDLVFCQICHGTAGGPGSNPRFNVPVGTMPSGCEECHVPLAAHPPFSPAAPAPFNTMTSVPWVGHSTAGNMASACVLCHGATLRGPAEGGVGPACTSCHTALQAGILPIPGTCTSCHGKPPAVGSHTIHNSLAGITDACATCHNGAGSGTIRHNNGTIDVSFATPFNARGSTAVFNADNSCTNVSCHGGITTPAWGGSINVATDCASCHTRGTAAQTPQYNSYYSGRHALHLDQIGLICSDCHDMSVSSGGASHFSGLGTPGFELAPRFTIRVPGYATTPGSCTPTSGSYSIGVCHGTKSWQ